MGDGARRQMRGLRWAVFLGVDLTGSLQRGVGKIKSLSFSCFLL